MRRWFAPMLMALLVGCAGIPDIASHESMCRGQTADFREIVDCVVMAINTDPKAHGPDHDLSDLYIAFLQVLAEQVEAEKITELEAKLEMVILRNAIEKEANRRAAERLEKLGEALQKMGQGMDQMQGRGTGY